MHTFHNLSKTTQPVALYLNSDIAAFQIQERHINAIKNIFPTSVICFNKDEFLDLLPCVEIAITWSFEEQWYPLASKLHTILTPAAGRERIAEDSNNKVKVEHGTFHGVIMAESLLSMMLWHSRELNLSFSAQKQKKWLRNELSQSKRLGSQHHFILGYGAIGRICAKYLKTLGATITGVKRSCRDAKLDDDADQIIHPDELIAYLPQADTIISVLPSGTDTDNLLTSQHFSAMKNGTYFYNIGRGNCYDENDLCEALYNGPLVGAGLDVFNQEPLSSKSALWDHPNTIITPHSSAIHDEYLDLYIKELERRVYN
ncbi:MAG: D-2-hydroxyacid dehydrogenase [Lentisphaeria bacterium]|nr:D-2-hydroxyacid dehydrogenase [Lentisphaeria bacterium]